MRQAYVGMAAVALLITLALTACGAGASSVSSGGSSSGASSGAAKGTVCQGLTTVHGALTTLGGTNASTTVGDVKAAQQKITPALNTITSRVPSGSVPALSQLKALNDQIAAEIAGYPDDTPIGQTSVKVQDLKARVATAQSKTEALATIMGCGPLPQS